MSWLSGLTPCMSGIAPTAWMSVTSNKTKGSQPTKGEELVYPGSGSEESRHLPLECLDLFHCTLGAAIEILYIKN